MNIHPDSSSPNSKVQILVSQNNNLSYFEYNDKKFGSTPLLDGLNDFLGKTNQKNTLSDLAKILDKNFTQPVPIGSEFANFLKENREAIQKIPEFKTHYFKANHLILEKETLPVLNFSDIVKKRKNRFYLDSTLFSESLNETSIVCNKKLSLAKDFIGPKGYSNHFGIREGDTIILGVTTLNPDTSGSFEGTFLFKEKDRNFRPIICSFKKGDAHEIDTRYAWRGHRRRIAGQRVRQDKISLPAGNREPLLRLSNRFKIAIHSNQFHSILE
jgi:hypothetical protein